MFEGMLVCWSTVFMWQEMFWGSHAGGASTGYEEWLDILGHGGLLVLRLMRGRRCFLIAILIIIASFISIILTTSLRERGPSEIPSKLTQNLAEVEWASGSVGASSGALEILFRGQAGSGLLAPMLTSTIHHLMISRF